MVTFFSLYTRRMQQQMDWDNNTQIPALRPEIVLAVKITASITCILSLFGASLIILTYVAFKDLRTIARQLLVNLSIADIIVVLSHFIGLFTNYERFIDDFYVVPFQSENGSWYKSTHDPVCITQGAFTLYGTVASFLWSMVIAVYLLVLSVWRGRFIAKAVPLFYILSWGAPIIVVVVNAVLRYIGFEPLSNTGWCYTTDTRPSICRDENRTDVDHFNAIAGDLFSYEMWLFICFIILSVLYLLLFFYMHWKRRSDEELQQLAKVDIKLLFVPVIFFLLTIWTAISDTILHYSSCNTAVRYRNSKFAAALVVLSGIGLNAQGIFNAILFCIFTKQIRLRLLTSIVKMCRIPCMFCKCKSVELQSPDEMSSDSSEETEESTKFISMQMSREHSINRGSLRYGTMQN